MNVENETNMENTKAGDEILDKSQDPADQEQEAGELTEGASVAAIVDQDEGAGDSAAPASGTVTVDQGEEAGEPAAPASGAVTVDQDEEAGEPAEESEEEESAPKTLRTQEGMDWYVLHTYSGYEKKVRDQLRERLRQEGFSEHVGRILVPEEDVVEIRAGKRKVSKRMFFPGYVMIEMKMSDKVWYVVKETQRITGFLGDAHSPVALSFEEVDRMMEQITGDTDKPKPKFSYSVGETVRVTDGPFANFTGVLDEVNMDRAKVKVMVSIFGRSTPVELEFSQIEKL